MSDLEVVDQLLSGLFDRHHPASVEAVVDPVAILRRFDIVLAAEIFPLLQILIRKLRVAVDVGIGKYLDSCCPHIVHILEAVLQVHGTSILPGITVEGNASLDLVLHLALLPGLSSGGFRFLCRSSFLFFSPPSPVLFPLPGTAFFNRCSMLLYDQQPSLIHMMAELRHEDHALLVRVQMVLDDRRHVKQKP